MGYHILHLSPPPAGFSSPLAAGGICGRNNQRPAEKKKKNLTCMQQKRLHVWFTPDRGEIRGISRRGGIVGNLTRPHPYIRTRAQKEQRVRSNFGSIFGGSFFERKDTTFLFLSNRERHKSW